jgi:hypothetical protein
VGKTFLDQALLSVSDPTSPSYGQHWTLKQVNSLTSNTPGG